MNQKHFIENAIYRYFFKARKPATRYMVYVQLFCELYPDICSKLNSNVCPFCGYRAARKPILVLHMSVHSPECGLVFKKIVERFVEMYVLAVTRLSYYHDYRGQSKYYRCTVCGYRARTKIEMAKHIIVMHAPLVDKLLNPAH